MPYDFHEADDPFPVFEAWLEDAKGAEPNDPTAMALATVDRDGLPDLRMVLMNAYDRRGFAFFTNLGSAKARELETSPKAALLFHWKSLRRQVRIRGQVVRVSEDEADVYYATRPRLSRIGAWASKQSRPLGGRAELEQAVAAREAEFEGREPPRPSWWSGFRVVPRAVEFWIDGAFRLHDRAVFERATPDDPWTRTRLYP